MIPATVYTPIVCAICKQPASGHDRVNGECFVYRNADVRPYALRRRTKTPTKGWVLR